jgi:23S rRNA (uracil1939-C5)-methyltransferase
VLYDEVQHTGDVRYVTVRQGAATGEILIGLVTRSPSLPEGEGLARHLMEHTPGAVGVVQNVNPQKGNVIFGSTDYTLAGRPFLEERVCSTRVRLGVTSFFQVNTPVAELAYQSMLRHVVPGVPAGQPAAEMPGAPDDVTFLDLYAGVGSIGLVAAPHVTDVVGIEAKAESVELARSGARLNHVHHAQFHVGPVEVLLREVLASVRARRGADHRVVAAVNPPRKGLETGVVELLIGARARRIAYLSCEPRTLLRDLVRFEAGGFAVRQVEVFDMFPQASQVETLAVLEPPA